MYSVAAGNRREVGSRKNTEALHTHGLKWLQTAVKHSFKKWGSQQELWSWRPWSWRRKLATQGAWSWRIKLATQDAFLGLPRSPTQTISPGRTPMGMHLWGSLSGS